MRTCKLCKTKYSLWQADFDGLCANCRIAKAEELRKQALDAEIQLNADAVARLQLIFAQIAPGEAPKALAIGVWESLLSVVATKLSNTVRLWTGRLFVGIAGDMLHSDEKASSFVGLVGLSETGKLHSCLLGKSPNVSPALILHAAIDLATASSVPLSSPFVSIAPAYLTMPMNGQQGIHVTFPSCFNPDNEHFLDRLQPLFSRSPNPSFAPQAHQP